MPSRLPIRLGTSGALMWRHPKAGPNPVLFLATGNGTLTGQNRTGVLTLTATGAQRYASTDWPGEQAFWIEEATTNLLLNPSVEVNPTGTAVRALGSATVTRDTTFAAVGVSSAKVVTTGAGLNEGLRLETARALGYTGSGRVFAGHVKVQGAGSLYAQLLALYTDASGTLGTKVNFTAAATRAQIDLGTVALDPAKTLDYIAVDVRQQATAASTYYVDAGQVEEKDHVTSFADGSLGTGYAWGGGANASASTRAAATLTIPNTAAPVSLAYRYSEDNGGTWQTGYRVGVGALGTNGLIAVSGSDLVISTTRSLMIGPIAGYDRALTAGEQTALAVTDPSNWWGALA